MLRAKRLQRDRDVLKNLKSSISIKSYLKKRFITIIDY